MCTCESMTACTDVFILTWFICHLERTWSLNAFFHQLEKRSISSYISWDQKMRVRGTDKERERKGCKCNWKRELWRMEKCLASHFICSLSLWEWRWMVCVDLDNEQMNEWCKWIMQMTYSLMILNVVLRERNELMKIALVHQNDAVRKKRRREKNRKN